jgi:hypothetical protein
MLYDVVVGGIKGNASGFVPAVQDAMTKSFTKGCCELSVPGLGIFPKGLNPQRQQSFAIESFGDKYILVCVRESVDVAKEITQCKRLLQDLKQHAEFSSLERVWLKMNGQQLLIAPETSDKQLAQIYLGSVYDGQGGMLRILGSTTSLEEYVFTAAAVRQLIREPVAFVWQGARQELKLQETPREMVGRLVFSPDA